jgi:hypothetical protein
MYSKDRSDLKSIGSSKGLKTSAYDPNVQIGNGHVVKHIDNNRTLIDGNLHHGASSAKKALKNLK